MFYGLGEIESPRNTGQMLPNDVRCGIWTPPPVKYDKVKSRSMKLASRPEICTVSGLKRRSRQV